MGTTFSSIFCHDLFKDRTVLVTGSSQGIGSAIAELFAALGAQVVAHGTSKENGQKVKTRITRSGGRCDLIAGDLADADQVNRMAMEAHDLVGGRLDYLIHNAAVCEQRTLTQLTLAEWNKTLSANLTSNFILTQRLLPALETGAGKSILLISSVVTRLGISDSAAYTASKAGQIGLMRTLAGELGKKGIRVNAILPGLVMVDRIVRQYGADYGKKIAGQNQLVSHVIQPEDIAASVAFLCSDAARAITGQCLDVNGGWVCS